MSLNVFEDQHHQPVKGLDALVSLVMELTVDRLVILVHHLEGVRAVPGGTYRISLFPRFLAFLCILPIHESVAIGGSTVRKQEGDLIERCHCIMVEISGISIRPGE